MNFLGHATVATWFRADAGYVLGSMLPDFASMARGRLRAVEHEEVAAGVALHHRTDAVFHALPTFQRWCVEGGRALVDAGVRRGTARAVAHIGPELILDVWLTERFDPAEAYRAALHAAAPDRLGEEIGWASAEDGARFERVRGRLLHFAGQPPDDDPEAVVFRLCRALDGRPRLAILPNDVAPVTRWLDEARARVRDEAPALVEGLARGLEAPA